MKEINENSVKIGYCLLFRKAVKSLFISFLPYTIANPCFMFVCMRGETQVVFLFNDQISEIIEKKKKKN